MTETLVVLAVIAVVILWLLPKFRDRRNRGCRDCQACLRPLVWRAGVAVTWGLIRAPFVAFMATCPQCNHVVGKHNFRADGSYID